MSARPAAVCAALLAALEAAEGRRRRRKRDQTPDAIGLAVKRAILEQAVRDDPEPERFEGWLLDYVQQADASGSACAMARAVLDEWRLAHDLPSFTAWLERGAPSEDAHPRRALGPDGMKNSRPGHDEPDLHD